MVGPATVFTLFLISNARYPKTMRIAYEICNILLLLLYLADFQDTQKLLVMLSSIQVRLG